MIIVINSKKILNRAINTTISVTNTTKNKTIANSLTSKLAIAPSFIQYGR